MALDQYLKTEGTEYFYGNRTVVQTELSEKNATKYCYTDASINYLYRHKKTDVYIGRNSAQYLDTKGYLLHFSGTGQPKFAFAYDGIDHDAGPIGTGTPSTADIKVYSGHFENNDQIIFNDRVITLVTVTTTDPDQIQIHPTDMNTQVSQIYSYFIAKASSEPTSMFAKFNYSYGSKGVNSLFAAFYISGKYLNNSIDNTPFGVISSNPYVIINADSTKTTAYLTYGDLEFTSKTIGYPGNNISILYSNITTGPVVASVSGTDITIDMYHNSTTAQEIVNAIAASGPATALITVAVTGTPSNPQSSFTPKKYLRSGSDNSSYTWKGCDILRNCFIVSPRKMYGYYNVTGDYPSWSGDSVVSVTPEYFTQNAYIPVYTKLIPSYHALQIMSNSTKNNGFWVRKNSSKRAICRIHDNDITTYEIEAITPGPSGNSYTFEVVLSDHVGMPGYSGERPYLTISGSDIVLHLGTRWDQTLPDTYGIVNYNDFIYALYSHPKTDSTIKDLIRIKAVGTTQIIDRIKPQTNFSGGATVAPADELIGYTNCMFDVKFGGIRYDDFGYPNEIAELDQNGKSRVITDTNYSTTGKFGCLGLRYIPAGTALKSFLWKKDLLFTAKTGGVIGDTISITAVDNDLIPSPVIVSVAGTDITITMKLTSTALDVKEAIEADINANALISVKIVGLPEEKQPAYILTYLAEGNDGLATDSGYVLVPSIIDYTPSNILNTGIKYYHLFYSPDLSDSSKFEYCVSVQSSWEGNIGFWRQTANRYVFELKNIWSVSGPSMGLYIYDTTTSSYYTSASFNNSYPRIYNMKAMDFNFTELGVRGNRYKITIAFNTGATKGSETIDDPVTEVNGDISIVINANTASTIADIKTAVTNKWPVDPIFTCTNGYNYQDGGYHPDTKVITSYPYDTSNGTSYFAGGCKIRLHDGLYGFGYVKMTGTYESINFNPNFRRLVPMSIPDALFIESIRFTDLG